MIAPGKGGGHQLFSNVQAVVRYHTKGWALAAGWWVLGAGRLALGAASAAAAVRVVSACSCCVRGRDRGGGRGRGRVLLPGPAIPGPAAPVVFVVVLSLPPRLPVPFWTLLGPMGSHGLSR